MAYLYNNILQEKLAFDTLSLTFNRHSVVSVNNEVFTDTKNVAGTAKDVLKDEFKPCGINCLKISEYQIELTLSAKILGIDYPKGISTDTIDKLIINLNSTGVIKIDPKIFKDTALVVRCDPVTDITINKPIAEYFNALFLLDINHKFNITPYGTANKTTGIKGVTAIAKAKYVKERISFYDKIEQLKKNPQFVKAYPQIRNYYQNKMRVESNLRGKAFIKEALQLTDNYLTSILNTQVNYNAILFQKIMKPLNNLVEPNTSLYPTFGKYITQLGYQKFVEDHKWNVSAMKATSKMFPRHNDTKRIIETANRLKQQQQPEAKGLLNEIEEQLVNAFVLV